MTQNPNERRRDVRNIFMQVSEAPEPQRAALLDRLCGGDEAVRREVEALLAADRQAAAGRFMTDPTASITPITTVHMLSESAGTRIGPYKLLQLIGEGGFGAVFLAEQDKPVRRRVALKIIKLGMDTRQVVARFEQEREALALMDHPNIARVFDAGATESGRPYFVMEYVKGDPIIAFADAHKLSVTGRLNLFIQVCHAVQHAHTKGIIHRDIKPSNILAGMVDGRPHAKVIDFGIAKATGARLTEKTLFTEHRQLIGTPEYMSPEQAEGSPDIDTRTDVYGLGVLLHELLTGLTPFDAKRLRSAAYGEMQRIIKEEEPLAPSMRLTRNLNTLAATAAARQVEPARLSGLLRGELDWIVMKALEKDRARRYESPNDLAADVQRHLTEEPVVAAPPSAAYRLRKFARKHKTSVLAVSAVVAALVLGIAGTTWQWRQVRASNLRLHSLVSQAKDGLGDMLNELIRGGVSQLTIPVTEAFTGVSSPDESPAPSSIVISTADGGKVILHITRDEQTHTPSITAIDSEGNDADRHVLSLLIANGVEGISTGNELRTRLAQEVREARLSKAQITIAMAENEIESAAEVDRSFLAGLHVEEAAAARNEYLGPANADTIRAEMCAVRTQACIEGNEDLETGDEWLGKLLDWEARRAQASDRPRMIDIDLWCRLAKTKWDRKQYEDCAALLRRIGANLTRIPEDDENGLWGFSSWYIDPFNPRNYGVTGMGDTVQLSRELECVTVATLYRRAALDSKPEADAREALVRAESLDAEAGRDPNPSNMALRAELLIRGTDSPGNRAQAERLIADASALAKEPAWADNPECQYRLRSANDVLHPQQPDARIAEQTRRARLAIASDVMHRRIAEWYGNDEDEGFSAEELRTTYESRKEYLGADATETIDAQFEYGAALNWDHPPTGLDLMRDAVERAEKTDAISPSRKVLMMSYFTWAAEVALDFDLAKRIDHKLADLLDSFPWPGYPRDVDVTYWGEAFVMFQSRHHLGWAVGSDPHKLSAFYRDRTPESMRPPVVDDMLDLAWISEYLTEGEHKPAVERAIAYAAQAIKADPDNGECYTMLAQAHYRDGDYQESLDAALRALDLFTKSNEPVSPYCLAFSSMAHFKVGGEDHFAQARIHLDQLRAVMADPTNAETIARDQTAQRLLKEAEELMQAPVSPNSP